jgi:hypothetical protein
MQMLAEGKELTANEHELKNANGRESFANSPQRHRDHRDKWNRGCTQIDADRFGSDPVHTTAVYARSMDGQSV